MLLVIVLKPVIIIYVIKFHIAVIDNSCKRHISILAFLATYTDTMLSLTPKCKAIEQNKTKQTPSCAYDHIAIQQTDNIVMTDHKSLAANVKLDVFTMYVNKCTLYNM